MDNSQEENKDYENDLFSNKNQYYVKAKVSEMEVCPPISQLYINKFTKKEFQQKNVSASITLYKYQQECSLDPTKTNLSQIQLFANYEAKQCGYFLMQRSSQISEMDNCKFGFNKLLEDFKEQNSQKKQEILKKLQINLELFLSPKVIRTAFLLNYEIPLSRELQQDMFDLYNNQSQYIEMIKPIQMDEGFFSMLFDGTDQNFKIAHNYISYYVKNRYLDLNLDFLRIQQDAGQDCPPDFSQQELQSIKIRDYSKKESVVKALEQFQQKSEFYKQFKGFNLIYILKNVKSSDFDQQEMKQLEYIQFYILVACNYLLDGSNMVIRFKSIYQRKTVRYIYLLANLFKRIYLSKPYFSDIYSNEMYIVCVGFQKSQALLVKDQLLDKYEDILNDKICLFDIRQIFQDNSFERCVYSFVHSLASSQNTAINNRIQEFQKKSYQEDTLASKRVEELNKQLQTFEQMFQLGLFKPEDKIELEEEEKGPIQQSHVKQQGVNNFNDEKMQQKEQIRNDNDKIRHSQEHNLAGNVKDSTQNKIIQKNNQQQQQQHHHHQHHHHNDNNKGNQASLSKKQEKQDKKSQEHKEKAAQTNLNPLFQLKNLLDNTNDQDEQSAKKKNRKKK